MLGCCTWFIGSQLVAQDKVVKPNETPKNIKILEEYKDRYGNIVRKIQYTQNEMLVTETTVTPPLPSFADRKPINFDTLNKDSLLVIVDKGKYTVGIVYKKKQIRRYRAVFGPDRMRDKMFEGDRSTPEGWFTISNVRDNKDWGKFIQINYPNDESFKKFNENKQKGLIPSGRSIGSSIGFHGTYPTGKKMVEMGIGWTDGCISMTTDDIYDFYKFVQKGTRVYIRK